MYKKHHLLVLLVVSGLLHFGFMQSTRAIQLPQHDKTQHSNVESKFFISSSDSDQISPWDSLYRHSAWIVVGEITQLNQEQLTIRSKGGSPEDHIFKLNEIQKLRTRPWSILPLNGSILEGSIVEIVDLNFFIETGPESVDSIAFSDIVAIFNPRSRPSRVFGEVIGKNNLELQLLYLNPILLKTFDQKSSHFKSGLSDGRRASSGSIAWFFKGLVFNIFAPIKARQYRPVPSLQRFSGKSATYTIGYVIGYGNGASSKNTANSTVGAVGNSMGIAMAVYAISVTSDPNFTN